MGGAELARPWQIGDRTEKPDKKHEFRETNGWLCHVRQKEKNRAMATESIGLPGQLLEKVKQAAAREEITPE